MKKLLRRTANTPGNAGHERRTQVSVFPAALRSRSGESRPRSTRNRPRTSKTLQISQKLRPILDTSIEQNVPSSNDRKSQKLLTAASTLWTFRDQRQRVPALVPSTMSEPLKVTILSFSSFFFNCVKYASRKY